MSICECGHDQSWHDRITFDRRACQYCLCVQGAHHPLTARVLNQASTTRVVDEQKAATTMTNFNPNKLRLPVPGEVWTSNVVKSETATITEVCTHLGRVDVRYDYLSSGGIEFPTSRQLEDFHSRYEPPVEQPRVPAVGEVWTWGGDPDKTVEIIAVDDLKVAGRWSTIGLSTETLTWFLANYAPPAPAWMTPVVGSEWVTINEDGRVWSSYITKEAALKSTRWDSTIKAIGRYVIVDIEEVAR